MPTKARISCPAVGDTVNPLALGLFSACAHYQRSDRPLFLAAYEELCRENLSGKKVLEVCCGHGDLAFELARAFPAAQVTAMDRYPTAGGALRDADGGHKLKNASYACGDALRLENIPDASLDLVYGQATLHHLAHDTEAVGKEMSRVLKPGGRLVFIFEPLGHNPVFAMIRAYRIARAKMPDESNIVLPQLEEIAQRFSNCEVQVFNLLGYPVKFLGKLAGESISTGVSRVDGALMRKFPRLATMAANFNAVFTR
jgi:SAM-dependent methyltransferase